MEQITLAEYKEMGYTERKERIKKNNERMVESMIENGFLLKQIRDDMSYRQDGYKDINEFAKEEFGYSSSTTSRFMSINTRFSENGNSPFIKAEYRNYGRSKLQEMLTMKEEDYDLITEETTIEQVRDLKNLEKQEEKAAEQEAQDSLPIVQMVNKEQKEQEEEVATSQGDPFDAVMIEYWKNRTEILKMVHNNMITPEDLAEELCPSGSKTFNHGIYMIFFYDINKGIKVRYYKDRAAQVDQYTYEEFISKTNEIITDEIFDKLVKPVQKEEQETEITEEPKKEWEQPEVVAKEEEHEKVPVPQAVERKKEETEYKPLPGQVTTDDIPELNDKDEETAAVGGEKDKHIVDADHKEVSEKETKNKKMTNLERIKNAKEENEIADCIVDFIYDCVIDDTAGLFSDEGEIEYNAIENWLKKEIV